MNRDMENGDKKIIFFDFDGVIIDSVGLSNDSYNKIWEPALTREEYVSRFDGNINEAVIGAPIQNNDLRPEDYPGLYHSHVLEQDLFQKVPEAIREIHAKYPLLFIVSSSWTDGIQKYLQHHSLDSYFTRVLGTDVHPKKTVKMSGILEEYGVKPADAVMVTDTLGDIREAASISIGSIAVSWGFQDGAHLLKGNPHRLIEVPEGLPAAIDDYFKTGGQ